jgi:cytochrome b
MARRQLVWDGPTRLFHWLLVASLIALWATAKYEYEELHVQLGYGVTGLLIFRILWGFFGTRHARFGNFLPSPAAVWRYARGWLGLGQHQHYFGHNPLGAIMVFVMLILLGVQVATGLFTEGDIWSGAWQHTVSGETSRWLRSIHVLNFDIILIAVALHIAAVFAYLLLKKTDLISPMFSGKKPVREREPGEFIAHSAWLRALIIAVVVAAFVYWLVVIAPPTPEPAYYF